MGYDLGKFMIIGGIVLICLGILFILGDRIPVLGRLPGDIKIERGNFVFYFPIVTSVLLSIILTILFNVFRK